MIRAESAGPGASSIDSLESALDRAIEGLLRRAQTREARALLVEARRLRSVIANWRSIPPPASVRDEMVDRVVHISNAVGTTLPEADGAVIVPEDDEVSFESVGAPQVGASPTVRRPSAPPPPNGVDPELFALDFEPNLYALDSDPTTRRRAYDRITTPKMRAVPTRERTTWRPARPEVLPPPPRPSSYPPPGVEPAPAPARTAPPSPPQRTPSITPPRLVPADEPTPAAPQEITEAKKAPSVRSPRPPAAVEPTPPQEGEPPQDNGSMPSVVDVTSVKPGAPPDAPLVSAQPVSLADPVDPLLVFVDQPFSLRADAYRALRRKLASLGGPRTIAVTSAVPGEGKTVLAVNLAFTLRETSRGGVLLVEVNHRAPAMAKLLGFRTPACFLQQLKAHVEAPGAAWVVAEPLSRLHVMALDPKIEHDPLLDPVAFAAGMEQLKRASYDFIVVDTPPVLNSVDCNVISDSVDGMIFAALTMKSKRKNMRKAVEQLDPAPIFGVVVLEA